MIAAIDRFLADVYSDFVRTDGRLHERLGRILDVALRCREMKEEGIWLDLLKSQYRDCRLSKPMENKT